jgi:hypothetical protein
MDMIVASSHVNFLRGSREAKNASTLHRQICLTCAGSWFGKLVTQNYVVNFNAYHTGWPSLCPGISMLSCCGPLLTVSNDCCDPHISIVYCKYVSEWYDIGRQSGYNSYRRNHHTTIKNQKTTIRKMMYHNQRHPWRPAMLFIRRNVPDKMPDVSAKASFCGRVNIKVLYL